MKPGERDTVFGNTAREGKTREEKGREKEGGGGREGEGREEEEEEGKPRCHRTYWSKDMGGCCMDRQKLLPEQPSVSCGTTSSDHEPALLFQSEGKAGKMIAL